MFFEILGSLEGLAAEVALVWLQGNVDADVRCDVVTLYSSCATGSPAAGQVQVVRTLAAYMAFANMVLCVMIRFLLFGREDLASGYSGDEHRAALG